jgi:hypothetical protein
MFKCQALPYLWRILHGEIDPVLEILQQRPSFHFLVLCDEYPVVLRRIAAHVFIDQADLMGGGKTEAGPRHNSIEASRAYSRCCGYTFVLSQPLCG